MLSSLTFAAGCLPSFIVAVYASVGTYALADRLGEFKPLPVGVAYSFGIETITGTYSFSGAPPRWLTWAANGVSLVIMDLPPLLVTLAVNHRLTFARVPSNGHTRCGHCGYILKGLVEPRCPECGRTI